MLRKELETWFWTVALPQVECVSPYPSSLSLGVSFFNCLDTGTFKRPVKALNNMWICHLTPVMTSVFNQVASSMYKI